MPSRETGRAEPAAASLARSERLLTELGPASGHTFPAPSGSKANVAIAAPAEMAFEIDGEEYVARLFNLSLEGGRLATSYKPPVGSLIRIGRITARVVRHFQDGVAVELVDIEEQGRAI